MTKNGPCWDKRDSAIGICLDSYCAVLSKNGLKMFNPYIYLVDFLTVGKRSFCRIHFDDCSLVCFILSVNLDTCEGTFAHKVDICCKHVCPEDKCAWVSNGKACCWCH